MKTQIAIVTAVLGAGLGAGIWATPPQQPAGSKGTPAAKTEFEKGTAALRQDDWDGAVEHFGKAAEIDPDYFEAHDQYVFVSTAGPKNYNNAVLFAELEARYRKWAKEHPDKAIFQYSLGHLYFYKKPEEAERYFQDAVKIDPKFAPAWDSLGILAEAQGKFGPEREYSSKAAEAWPDNPRYARHAADAWFMADFALFRQASMAFVARYPEEAPNQLSYLSLRALRYEDSKSTLELIHSKYMPQGASQLQPLFDYYLREDPAKGLKLATEVRAARPNDKSWSQLEAYARALIDARAAIGESKAAGALAALGRVSLPPRADRRMLEVALAEARQSAGELEPAYTGLLKVFAAKPSDEIQAGLLAAGGRLGKDVARVAEDVYQQRSSAAKPGIPFASTTYPDGRPIKLEDYRGKTFLLNFWYPLCGPCRGEFPSLKAVLDKYKGRGFQIVAINVHPNEDSWVMPLMKGWDLGFLPIHGGDELMKAYNVKGAPSNFLYGPDGRIYYAPGPVNTYDARRELELQIEALLDRQRGMEK